MRHFPLWIGLGISLLALATPAAAQKTAFRTLDGRRLLPTDIDRTVRQLMDSAKVPGLALALLEDNQVRYLRTYGSRDLGQAAPLEPQTAMYGASL
ncbi:MAG TPA: serine hydrolase, partial [Hymenobacter sp.]|nr:serine hydrolase [Hymenobacter sp.]